MAPRIPRREFLAGVGALAAASAVSSIPCHAMFSAGPMYPPVDLSYFDKAVTPAPAEIRLGCAAITRGGNDRQAIADISALGFRGVQLRANCIAEFGSPAELKRLLEANGLRAVALSSGAVNIDPAKEAFEIAKHSANARFVHDGGGLYLQVTDERSAHRPITASDYARLSRLLTEIGKRTADLGITLGYQNQMGSMGERPEGLDRILQAVDSRYAKLALDIAHYFQGGGDSVQAIERYKDVLLFLHIKDVELARRSVDPSAVFEALHKVNFHGWAMVELDDDLGNPHTPRESAEISKKYVEEKLGLRV